MNCTQCGSPVSEQERYCAFCGHPAGGVPLPREDVLTEPAPKKPQLISLIALCAVYAVCIAAFAASVLIAVLPSPPTPPPAASPPTAATQPTETTTVPATEPIIDSGASGEIEASSPADTEPLESFIGEPGGSAEA